MEFIMNECYLIIQIISEINFKFIINQKQKSIVIFKAKLLNDSEVTIVAYDELADYIYKNQPKNMCIRGEIISEMKVAIKEIYKKTGNH